MLASGDPTMPRQLTTYAIDMNSFVLSELRRLMSVLSDINLHHVAISEVVVLGKRYLGPESRLLSKWNG